jgi:hypothetical protein
MAPLARRVAATALPIALTALVLTALPADARAKPAYSATPGAQVADASFVASYKGAGKWHTVFHGEPHNPNGPDDTNDAKDSSAQSWDLRYTRPITIPTCGQPADGSADPCASLGGPTQAKGVSLMTGRVSHKHVDGPYPELNRKVKCTLRKRIGPKRKVEAAIRVRHLPDSGGIGVTVYDPLETVLSFFSSQCPKQGDSIDRILDFYATPGFSFAPPYGPERWFTSREVVIPEPVWHGSSEIAIPLADTVVGTPPRRCAVPNPEFERCKTGGSWAGVLTLKRRAQASAARTAAKVRAPRSTRYEGTARGKKFTLYVSGKSIALASLAFACGDVDGSTTLNDIELRKTRKGYKFGIEAHGSIGYSDEAPEENGAVDLSGRFSKDGKRASGVFRVKSHRCGNSGNIRWSAHR